MYNDFHSFFKHSYDCSGDAAEYQSINEFIECKAVWGSYRISCIGLWLSKVIGSSRKTISEVDVCKRAQKDFPLLSVLDI